MLTRRKNRPSGLYVWVFMARITVLVLFTGAQDSLLSVSVRRVHVVFSTVGFKGGGKPCLKTRETAALRSCGIRDRNVRTILTYEGAIRT